MITTVIIEDQKPESDFLLKLLDKHFPEIKVLHTCSTASEGITIIKSLQPQLVFLDVELDHHYTGFDVLEHTQAVNYETIFTTSYSEYAQRAFRFSALDYLKKPIGLKELTEAIQRYKNLTASGNKRNIEVLLHNAKEKDITLHKVGLPVYNGTEFIPVSEIIMCKAHDIKIGFVLTGNRNMEVSKPLKWVDELMDAHHFFRVHDSHTINLAHIIRYGKGGEGGIAYLTDDNEAPVSRRRKEAFLKKLAELNMIIGK